MIDNVSVTWLCVILFGLSAATASEVYAGPNCNKKPDHPSCPGGGGGGEPPPVESDPAYAYVFKGSIYLMNEDGSAPTLFLESRRAKGRNNPGISFDGPEWDPSGGKLAYSRNSILEVAVLDGGSSPLPSDSDIPAGGSLSWSSSGEQIAYSTQTGSERDDVFAINVGPANSGGPAKNVTDSLAGEPGLYGPIYGEPSWSADGTRLAFRHWSFSSDPVVTIYDILICEPFDGPVEPTCDATNTLVWREFDDSYHIAPVFHPSDDVIGYVPQGVEMFIESVDGAEVLGQKSCIQIYNSNPNRTAPVLRSDCVHKDVGNFYFGGNFDWSCDGQSLVVTGNFDDGDPETAGNWGIHRIDKVFDATDGDLTNDIASLITADSNADGPQSPTSRCTGD